MTASSLPITETNDGLAYVVIALDIYLGNILYSNAKSNLMGVKDNDIEGFTFYPNPTQDILNLSAENIIGNVCVYTLTGQKVMQLSPGKKNSSYRSFLSCSWCLCNESGNRWPNRQL